MPRVNARAPAAAAPPQPTLVVGGGPAGEGFAGGLWGLEVQGPSSDAVVRHCGDFSLQGVTVLTVLTAVRCRTPGNLAARRAV